MCLLPQLRFFELSSVFSTNLILLWYSFLIFSSIAECLSRYIHALLNTYTFLLVLTL